MPIKRSYSAHGDACATSHAMELLGDRWTYPVIRELMLAPKRFTELEASLRGITPAVLTARLRQLEVSGMVRRVTLPAPARLTAYAVTEWTSELQPILESLGRWALRSPVRDVAGGGLTPDAIVQSMLTMAPRIAMAPPIDMELHLADQRVNFDTEPYVYRLTWGDKLLIERSSARDPIATVGGDSSTWASILYQGEALDLMNIMGDRATVERVVAAFSGVLEAAA